MSVIFMNMTYIHLSLPLLKQKEKKQYYSTLLKIITNCDLIENFLFLDYHRNPMNVT
jgi:hypothetical protein